MSVAELRWNHADHVGRCRRGAPEHRGYGAAHPLVPLPVPGDTEVWLKLENLQPIGAFKISQRSQVMARMPRDLLARGVLRPRPATAQGVAFCARRIGVPATIVAPDTLRRPRFERWNGSAGRDPGAVCRLVALL